MLKIKLNEMFLIDLNCSKKGVRVSVFFGLIYGNQKEGF